MKISRYLPVLCLLAVHQGSVPATNQTFTYDARGRLKVSCQAQQGIGNRTTYSIDKSDNRTNLTTKNEFFGITAGTGVWSADGRFYFTTQTDGNLVLYGPSGALWASGAT
jgi:hypothetical protein